MQVGPQLVQIEKAPCWWFCEASGQTPWYSGCSSSCHYWYPGFCGSKTGTHTISAAASILLPDPVPQPDSLQKYWRIICKYVFLFLISYSWTGTYRMYTASVLQACWLQPHIEQHSSEALMMAAEQTWQFGWTCWEWNEAKYMGDSQKMSMSEDDKYFFYTVWWGDIVCVHHGVRRWGSGLEVATLSEHGVYFPTVRIVHSLHKAK